MPGGRLDILASAETGQPYAAVLPKLTDYFELDHIRRLTQWLEDEKDLTKAGSLLAAGVAVHCTKLSDAWVAAASISMIDDLYKGMNAYAAGKVSIPISDSLATYLRATANSLLGILHDRGYRLEYAVENSFPNGYGGPVYYYKEWFRAAGFAYVSPFDVAIHLMEHDGHGWHEFEQLWPKYRDEARIVASEGYERVRANAEGWVLLDEDAAEPPLASARSSAPRPGVVHLFRSALPVAGTQVEMRLPDGLRAEVDRIYDSTSNTRVAEPPLKDE